MDVDSMIWRINDFEAMLDEVTMDVVEERAAEGVVQIKNQLLEGEDRNREATRPGYAEDPWFKNGDGWKQYVAAKERRYPGVGVPKNGGVNLIWNGSLLQDYLTWYREGDEVVFECVGSPIWEEVSAKWGLQCFAPNYDWIRTEILPKVKQDLLSIF